MIDESLYDFQRNLEKDDRIVEETKMYPLTQIIMLGHCALNTFPRQILASKDEINWLKLRRLDLTHNSISTLPNSLSRFSNLRELWLSYNPMTIFPPIIAKLTKLECIDIRGTQISEIPTFIVELKEMVELDWRETPAEQLLIENYKVEVNDLPQLCYVYRNINVRNKTKYDLYILFSGELYLLDVDKPYTKSVLHTFVEELSTEFDVLEDFESFARRPVKFVPAKVDEIKVNKSAAEAKHLFYEMKRETDRKRLSADVEIKIRGMYFDRIERSEVITLLDSIYVHVKSLEDIQFLVQYAPLVLPAEVPDATGEKVWQNIVDLQDDLIRKREASVIALANSMNQLYPEQRPEALVEKAREIAFLFQKDRFATKKELLRMTQLTADAAKVFPPDFASITPRDVLRQAFELIFKNL